MSKKKLQVDGIMNELEGASLFFKPASTASSPLPPSDQVLEPATIPEPTTSLPEVPLPENTLAPEEIPTDKPYNEPKGSHASKRASVLASIPSTKSHDLIRTIRNTVKRMGKEVLFVRLSPDEKHTLGQIVYSFNEMYRPEGRKTSENEIGRIALNYLLVDYRENGNNSILAQVLAALIA